jgi:hypothetical protein
MPSHEASLRNLAKAREKWRPPRPWRSAQESRIIKLLSWQWFTYRGHGKWSARALGRRLGVSHSYVQKLVRAFTTNPSEMQRDARRHASATFEHLRHAQEETRKQKERGWLRPPCRRRWVSVKIGDQLVRTVVQPKASSRGLRIPQDVPIWATGASYYSSENPCDPLVAVQYVMQQRRESKQVPTRLRHWRWRPGRPGRF